jgi:hypothetical protein
MVPDEIRWKRNRLEAVSNQVAWCDDRRLDDENMPEAAPGGYLNKHDWYVIGTTIGGNAIVVRANDPGVYFADYTWFDDDSIGFQDFRNGGEWITLEFNEENLRRSLHPLAPSIEGFVESIESIDKELDRIG